MAFSAVTCSAPILIQQPTKRSLNARLSRNVPFKAEILFYRTLKCDIIYTRHIYFGYLEIKKLSKFRLELNFIASFALKLFLFFQIYFSAATAINSIIINTIIVLLLPLLL